MIARHVKTSDMNSPGVDGDSSPEDASPSMKPAPLWDMELSVDFRHALTRYKAPLNKEWNWPLYGYKADEILSKACCAWADFIGTFVLCWNEKFNYDPHPEIVKQARTLWKRWSMTGYEAYVTMMQKARML